MVALGSATRSVLGGNLTYTYTATYADFLAAQCLHLKATPRDRGVFVFWHRVMPVASCCCLALLFWDFFIRHALFAPWLAGLLAGAGFLGIFGLVYRPFALRKAYRNIVQNRGAGDAVELEIQDGQIISRTPGRNEGRFSPTGIHRFEEDDNVALVYIGRKVFLFLPKRALPQKAWTEIYAFLGEHRRKPC